MAYDRGCYRCSAPAGAAQASSLSRIRHQAGQNRGVQGSGRKRREQNGDGGEKGKRQAVWPGAIPKPLAPYSPAIKAGGWLFVEDTDLATVRRFSCPQPQRVERAYLKFIEAMSAAGFQPTYAARLGDELRALGLDTRTGAGGRG